MTASKTLFGHPRALVTLFLIELWERASYYGMRAILVLYMAAAIAAGGLGYDESRANMFFGLYSGAVWLTPLLGGYIADRWLGARRTMLLGGVVIAFGHLLIACGVTVTFFAGLSLIALGTGLLKPNVNTLVGHLYAVDDPKRTAGFNIMYMGINVGAALAPVVCGFLAQSDAFKAFLERQGFDPLHSWHWGFGAAGVGMVFGLVQYWLHRDWLADYGNHSGKPLGAQAQSEASEQGETSGTGWSFTREEMQRIKAMAVMFVAFMGYSAINEQAGSSLSLFAQRLTETSIFGWHFPSSWMMSLNPLFVIALTPLFAWLWPFLSQRHREPSSPLKFAIGLAFVAAGTSLMVPASLLAMQGKVSPLWLAAVFFLQTVGELCLSPVGLSTVNQLAPSRFASMAMGFWYLSICLGSVIAGKLAGLLSSNNPHGIAVLFGVMAGCALLAAIVMRGLTPAVKRMMASR